MFSTTTSMEDDHAASFITALANLQPSGSVEVHLGGVGAAEGGIPATPEELASLEGWSIDQLKAEVVRLRRTIALRDLRELRLREDVNSIESHEAETILQSHLTFPSFGVQSAGSEQVEPGESMGALQTEAPATLVPETHPSTAAGVGTEEAPSVTRAVRKRAAAQDGRKVKRHEGTGKRVERSRRVELARAIRTKMRMEMGIGNDSPLPPPSALTNPDATVDDAGWVPNWLAGIGDDANVQWLDRVCAAFIAEARESQGWGKVPPEDLEDEIVKTAARTSFLNFAKRYMAAVDPTHAMRKEKYVKNRRRWARKDLKQKRRSKAALDPSFGDTLPASALHIDYMSSEYSSAGEDDPEEATGADDTALPELRRSQWLNTLRLQSPDPSKGSGKGGWPDGVSEKVLEVRTPTWRSARLDDIYRRLDTISAASAALRATPASQQPNIGSPGTKPPSLRLGHVAPSHRRFTMPPDLMRRGRLPRDTGENWMWSSGQAGVWPASEREVVQAVDAVQAVQAAADAAAHETGMGTGVQTDVETGVEMDHVGVVDLHSATEVPGVEHIEDMDPAVDALVKWTEVES